MQHQQLTMATSIHVSRAARRFSHIPRYLLEVAELQHNDACVTTNDSTTAKCECKFMGWLHASSKNLQELPKSAEISQRRRFESQTDEKLSSTESSSRPQNAWPKTRGRRSTAPRASSITHVHSCLRRITLLRGKLYFLFFAGVNAGTRGPWPSEQMVY